MWTDPVVAEIRAIREGLAARFDYDVQALSEHARQCDARGDRQVVRRPPRQPVVQAHIVQANVPAKAACE